MPNLPPALCRRIYPFQPQDSTRTVRRKWNDLLGPKRPDLGAMDLNQVLNYADCPSRTSRNEERKRSRRLGSAQRRWPGAVTRPGVVLVLVFPTFEASSTRKLNRRGRAGSMRKTSVSARPVPGMRTYPGKGSQTASP